MKELLEIKMKGTLAERTYELLKTAIVEIDLKPGQLITEEELSERLGVSRTPIRTALNHLLHEELIEIIPGKGTFVTRITEKQVNDLLNVRGILESMSVQLAASLRTDEDLEKMKYLLYRQEEAYNSQYKSLKDYLIIDSEFHCLIANISDNKYLGKVLSDILSNCRRYLIATSEDFIFQDVIKEHNELFEQIKNKDVEKSKLCMQMHIKNVKARMLDGLVI